jgi:hypothetical protein
MKSGPQSALGWKTRVAEILPLKKKSMSFIAATFIGLVIPGRERSERARNP